MGWLIASEFVGGDRPIGTWNNGRISGHTDELLTRGSVCVDVMLRNGVVKPSRLIHFETDRGWARRFILFLNPDGSISVEHRQGAGHAYVRVSPGGRNSQRLRIVYSWDAPARIGLLSVEDLDAGTIRQAEQAAPLPVPMGDLRDIAAGRDTCCVDAAVLSIAIQDDVQRIGPGPSIAAGVPIRTAMGYSPVEQIRPGDLVITRSGEALPVRWVIGDTRPGVGYSAPVRLRAPYLGLGSDITLTSTHMVQITAGDIEHSLGRNTVLAEAGALTAHPGIGWDRSRWVVPYFQILLDRHACLDMAGLWAESLFVGRLRQAPAIVASSHFADLGAGHLPLHKAPVGPPLADYERLSVLDAISA